MGPKKRRHYDKYVVFQRRWFNLKNGKIVCSKSVVNHRYQVPKLPYHIIFNVTNGNNRVTPKKKTENSAPKTKYQTFFLVENIFSDLKKVTYRNFRF